MNKINPPERPAVLPYDFKDETVIIDNAGIKHTIKQLRKRYSIETIRYQLMIRKLRIMK